MACVPLIWGFLTGCLFQQIPGPASVECLVCRVLLDALCVTGPARHVGKRRNRAGASPRRVLNLPVL